MAEAKFKFSLKDGIFEIEGPETFVSSQLQAFGDVFRKALSEPAKAIVALPTQEVESTSTIGARTENYSSVFEVHEGKVKVLKDIPGAKKQEKTINAALLCLFARSQEGVEVIPYDDIREICRDHSFYDVANFSKYLKSDKSDFVFGGSRGKQTVKLSAPGRKRAEALVKELSA